MTLNKSPEQWSILTEFFKTNNYPDKNDTEMLANQTGLQTSQVRDWFKRHRPIPSRKFNTKITSILNIHFHDDMDPSLETRKLLANETKLSLRQVTDWFCYTRLRQLPMVRRELVEEWVLPDPVVEEWVFPDLATREEHNVLTGESEFPMYAGKMEEDMDPLSGDNPLRGYEDMYAQFDPFFPRS